MRLQIAAEEMRLIKASEYSLVMTAFQGKYMRFQEEAERQFGRKCLSAFCLCASGEDYLPSEIAAGLTYGQAARIAEALRVTGATIYVMPTGKVDGVLYRASECWPSRSAGRWHFTEVEEMVLTLTPLNARHNIRFMRRKHPDILPWQIENYLNHRHPTTEPDPEFPKADWGECATCGAEILIRTWEERAIV